MTTSDQLLAREAASFYQAIAQIADLGAWRTKVAPPPTHWWWYLDVLAHVWPQLQPLAAEAQPLAA